MKKSRPPRSSDPDEKPSTMAGKSSNFEKKRKHMKNRQRLGGNGLSLQAFANAKSQSSYNPHLIKKQREMYQNAKLIKKYKKSLKQQSSSEDRVPSIPIPELQEADRAVKHEKKAEMGWKKKISLQSAREEYEKGLEEEEKARMEREAIIQAKKEERARAEGRRKALKERMFKKTRSGQPVMKYRIQHLLQGFQSNYS